MSTKEINCLACESPGADLNPWVYSVPEALAGAEVEIEISHCGVCHSDLHQINDAWNAACWPLVPGHEVVGRIAAVGPAVANGLKVGMMVGIGVQRGSCGDCGQCNQGREHTCPKITKTYAGPGKDKGGFAERIRYPSDWVFRIPDGLAPADAAPLLCAGITTFSPLKKWVGRAPDDCTVAIVGVGGLGHIAVQIASKMPKVKKVIAVSRSTGTSPLSGQSKKDEALAFGADEFLASTDPDAMAAAAGSVDVILSTVPSGTDLDDYLSLLTPNGAMVCVGLPPKDPAHRAGVYMQSLVPTEKQVSGSYLGPKADYEEMLAFCATHGVRPAIKTFPASEVNTALSELAANTLRYRAVLIFPAGESDE